MTNNIYNDWDKFNKLLGSFICNPTKKDYAKFDSDKNLLLRLANVENSSITIFDFHKKEYTFFRHKFNSNLGLSSYNETALAPAYYFKIMHPDDISFVLDTTIRSFEFLLKQAPSEVKNYKLAFEYRLLNSKGEEFRFLQQIIVLEQTEEGEIWLVMIVNDLLQGQVIHRETERKMINMITGEICLFNDDLENKSKNILTKRELEILGLISQGYQSKQISDKLFISINTVNNHRQNIISKMKVEGTNEALEYAKILGII